MPYDPVMESALAVAAPRCGPFRTALASAVGDVEGMLASRRMPATAPSDRASHELGAFAADRLDPERFASLFGEHDTFDERSLERVRRAHDLLKRQLDRGGPWVTRVAPGGDLASVVDAALAEVGRAFAAARSIARARSESPAAGVADHLVPFPYSHWNRAEKRIAPPLVVEVDGGDLQVGALARYIDGQQLLVLVVRAPAPAAPLVRLISPGVTVVQGSDPDTLAAAIRSGPCVIALMPADAAAFIHRAGNGPAWERLAVQCTPAAEPQTAIGTFSVFQQQQEIALLRELSRQPPAAENPSAAFSNGAAAVAVPQPVATPPDPVDQLAAWLLDESGITRG